MYRKTHTIDETSPATAGTVVGAIVDGLDEGAFFEVDAELRGATGGTLNVYLQREIATGIWRDWLHFPELAGGAAERHYFAAAAVNSDITVVGDGTTPALAANTMVGGHPGDRVRAVYVAGTGTSVGAPVLIHIHSFRAR